MLSRVKNNGGYTLLEMLVVLAIVGVLVVVAVPNFMAWNQKFKLKSDVANLAGTLAFARMTAINQNTAVIATVDQLPSGPVTVTFTSPLGAPILPPITMDGVVQLTDAVGGTGASPQDVRFNNMGSWVNTGTVNNICIPTACPAVSQVLNFRNSGPDNYRIVILQTGKIIWCNIPACTQ
jgi:prepilin-type N-terminal cleavage/methylation domain-containing protein